MESSTEALADTAPPKLSAWPTPAAPVTPARPRWFASLLFSEVVVVALVVLSAVLVSRRLDSQRDVLAAQQGSAQGMQERLEALQAQTKGLTDEVVSLRQSMASHTGEDVLFLRVLLLKPEIDLALARTIAGIVHRAAAQYGRDPNLVLAIMAVESDFNPQAISSVGAVGLMQVMPHWKRVLSIQGDLTNPEVNISTGLQILGFYFEMYRDPEMVLTAYNRGPGPVDNALVKGRDARNGYAAKVLATYERLKQYSLR